MDKNDFLRFFFQPEKGSDSRQIWKIGLFLQKKVIIRKKSVKKVVKWTMIMILTDDTFIVALQF